VPVCSNCGGNDFVWAENLKTGGLGRGGLSLRSGGELAIGTRVCRGCGHADLFVKDPTVLRQPHTWKPGEFVPILPRPTGPQKPPETAPVPAAPVAVPPHAAPPQPALVKPPPPAPPPTAAPAAAVATGTPAPPESPPATAEAAGEGDAARKRPSRRKGTKAKPSAPPLVHE